MSTPSQAMQIDDMFGSLEPIIDIQELESYFAGTPSQENCLEHSAFMKKMPKMKEALVGHEGQMNPNEVVRGPVTSHGGEPSVVHHDGSIRFPDEDCSVTACLKKYLQKCNNADLIVVVELLRNKTNRVIFTGLGDQWEGWLDARITELKAKPCFSYLRI